MRLERRRLLRRGDVPRRQVVHHAGQRRLGRQRHGPLQPQRHGRLGERDHGTIKYQDKNWYRFRVRVTGEVIRCWVDDKEVIAVDYQDQQVGTRVETRPNEPLGFATWKTGGALRKIEIRTLSPDEIAATNKID